MTQSELDDLPDVTGGFDSRVEIREGRRVIVPVRIPVPASLFIGPEDGLVVDQHQTEWMVGQLDGRRVKRRIGAHL